MPSPPHNRQRQHHICDRGSESSRANHGEHKRRDSKKHVNHTHNDHIQNPTEVAAYQPENGTHRSRYAYHYKGYLKRNTGSVRNPTEDIASEVISATQMLKRRRLEGLSEVDLLGLIWGDVRRKGCENHDHENQ